jgi:hypothetical protein
MRSHRGSWLGSSVLAATLVLAPAAATVRAQPGYGPDPFWPYNNQYTPYVTPIGPASPEGGQGGALNARDGLRGANQFQNYLEDLQGPGRNKSDRSNIGMPYYRSAADPTLRGRDYQPNQPNRNASARENTFQEAQRRAADVYFRYYGERDPARRAELLREYRGARRDAELALSGRRRSPSRVLDSSARLESGSRRGARTSGAAGRSGAADRTRDELDRFGPAPEVPAIGTRRSSGSSSLRTPTDILNRSRAMDREDGAPPIPGSSSPSLRSRSRGTADRLDRVLPSPGFTSPSLRSRSQGTARPAPTLPTTEDDSPPTRTPSPAGIPGSRGMPDSGNR